MFNFQFWFFSFLVFYFFIGKERLQWNTILYILIEHPTSKLIFYTEKETIVTIVSAKLKYNMI